jgi:hypothetical protein
MLLTNRERDFLAAFVREATTDPFKGPATEELHRRDIYYTDLRHLLAAYYQETPLIGKRLPVAITRSSYNWSKRRGTSFRPAICTEPTAEGRRVQR